MKRPSGSRRLPPFWIRACSWFFLVFLFSPLVAIGKFCGGGELHVSMLGMTVGWDTGPKVWMLFLGLLLFAAGITALAIVMRWKWAYDFGVAYASMGILVGALGLLANVGGVRDNLQLAAIQHAALAVFLVHLVRHRLEWKDQTANNPLQPTSGGHTLGEIGSSRSPARG